VDKIGKTTKKNGDASAAPVGKKKRKRELDGSSVFSDKACPPKKSKKERKNGGQTLFAHQRKAKREREKDGRGSSFTAHQEPLRGRYPFGTSD
jgi:hypothetical protein